MRPTAISLLALAGIAAASAAHATEESQALAARALIEANRGDDRAALALLDRAVDADPSDVNVRYQRGVTRSKLHDYDGAIGDLTAVLDARPDFPAAALELGAALSESGRYQQAIPWLQRAQADPALDGQASFFLGLAQLRLDQFEAANASFERAASRDPSLTVQAQYYQGVVAYRQHEYGVAEERFTAVQSAVPNSVMGQESVRFRELIRRSNRAAYRAFGGVALEYDTNVTLGPAAPSNPAAVSGEADGRFVIDAGGQFIPWSSGPASLVLSYEFFQSLQFQLTDFNLQDNRPGVQLLFDFDPILFGVLTRYDYYLRSTDSFLQEATVFPWVTLRESGIGHTDVYGRVQWRDYKQQTFAVLNGFYSYGGVRQFIELGAPDRVLWIGYQLGFNDMENGGSEVFQFGAQEAEVAIRWPLPYLVTAEAGYRYEYQTYAPASAALPPAGGRRVDNDHRIIVSFERPLPEIDEHLFATASWYGTFNRSDKPDFEYDRQIGSIGVEVRF